MKSSKPSEFRKLSIYGFQATENGHNFFALLEFDITDARAHLRELRSRGEGGSLFAFAVKAIGACLARFPECNSMGGISRISTFEEVDISVPIEIIKDGEVFNKQLVIRNVEAKTVSQIDAEISDSKRAVDEGMSYVASPLYQRILTALPGFVVRPFFRAMLSNHKLVKKLSGTAFVTSVSMFSNVPGFIVPFIGGPKASSFAVGSVNKKPVVRGGEVVIREIINVTASFNHDLIDGAPAARCINQLRKYLESDYRELLSN